MVVIAPLPGLVFEERRRYFDNFQILHPDLQTYSRRMPGDIAPPRVPPQYMRLRSMVEASFIHSAEGRLQGNAQPPAIELCHICVGSIDGIAVWQCPFCLLCCHAGCASALASHHHWPTVADNHDLQQMFLCDALILPSVMRPSADSWSCGLCNQFVALIEG